MKPETKKVLYEILPIVQMAIICLISVASVEHGRREFRRGYLECDRAWKPVADKISKAYEERFGDSNVSTDVNGLPIGITYRSEFP